MTGLKRVCAAVFNIFSVRLLLRVAARMRKKRGYAYAVSYQETIIFADV